MRFLHTSDWHIGRTVRTQSRHSEQEAALQQVLAHAREKDVDCVLIAGDVFDTAAPGPESEKLVYDFFREVHGAGVPVAFIAGNHDHPKRVDAVAPLLASLQIHARGVPRASVAESMINVPSRDGRETAMIAALPWVNERDTVDFLKLQDEAGGPLLQYAERMQQTMAGLASGYYDPDAVRIMLGHMLVDESMVGPGGGERDLHMNMGIYGVRRAALPVGAQYIALGHVHKNQDIPCSSRAAYSGSLLQLDFGERDQDKYVNLVEVHPRQPAEVTPLPITAGRRLVDIGSPARGVSLDELAPYRERNDDSWFRVFVDVDAPVADLAQTVRADLPSAVAVERTHRDFDESQRPETLATLGSIEMFQRFYESGLGRDKAPSEETLTLFRQLLTEAEDASPEA